MRAILERGSAFCGRLLVFSSAISCGAALAEPQLRYLSNENVKQTLPPKEDPSKVDVLDSPSPRAQVRIGKVQVRGDPGSSRDELVRLARAKAAEVGADFVRVIGEADVTTRSTGPPGSAAFSGLQRRHSGVMLNNAPLLQADVGVFAKATLGVEYMSSALIWRRHAVKGFRPASKASAAGVEIGDEIIEVDGINPLDEEKYVHWILASAPGQVATLRLKRGESMVTVQVPLVSND
jgi:hypothetical protein